MKEEFLKFKGKMCWLYLNHEVLDEITIYRGAVEHFNEKKYKGQFIIKNVQWYNLNPMYGKKYY